VLLLRSLLLFIACMSLPALSLAQGAFAFGTVRADPLLPVEATADSLSVNQSNGSADFLGNVLIIQGAMRLSADTVHVVYKVDDTDQQTGIESLQAKGNVILVNGPDAAEAQQADYSIDTGTIVLNGDVLLTQGASTLTSNQLVVNLTSGTAEMSGRVKTILVPGKN